MWTKAPMRRITSSPLFLYFSVFVYALFVEMIDNEHKGGPVDKFLTIVSSRGCWQENLWFSQWRQIEQFDIFSVTLKVSNGHEMLSQITAQP